MGAICITDAALCQLEFVCITENTLAAAAPRLAFFVSCLEEVALSPGEGEGAERGMEAATGSCPHSLLAPRTTSDRVT